MYLIKNYGLFDCKSNKPAVRVESQGARGLGVLPFILKRTKCLCKLPFDCSTGDDLPDHKQAKTAYHALEGGNLGGGKCRFLLPGTCEPRLRSLNVRT